MAKRDRTMVGRALGAACVLGLVFAQAACGIAGGQHIQNVRLHGPGDIIRTGAKEATVDANVRLNTVQVVDTWGVLISMIASNNNAVAARDSAVRAAVENGAVSGDEVEYRYEYVPPRPGVISTVRVSWGEIDDAKHMRPAGMDQPDLIHSTGKLAAFDFDFTVGLGLWGFEDCCNLGLTLSAAYQSWEAEALDVKATRVAMPIGLSLGRDLFARTHLAVVAKYDVTSLITMAINDHWLDYSYGAQLNVVLLSWLHLQFDATRGQIAINDGDGWGEVWQVGALLTAIYAGGDDGDDGDD